MLTPGLSGGSPLHRTHSSADPVPWPASPFPHSASIQRRLVLPSSLGFSRTTLYLGPLPCKPSPAPPPRVPSSVPESPPSPGGPLIPPADPSTPVSSPTDPLGRPLSLSLSASGHESRPPILTALASARPRRPRLALPTLTLRPPGRASLLNCPHPGLPTAPGAG